MWSWGLTRWQVQNLQGRSAGCRFKQDFYITVWRQNISFPREPQFLLLRPSIERTRFIQFRVIALCFRQKIFNFLLPVKLQPCLCKVLWKLPVWACSFRGPVRFTIYFLFAWQRTFDCLPNSHLSLGHLPSENLFLLFVFAERELDFYVVPSSFSFFYKDRKKVGEE